VLPLEYRRFSKRNYNQNGYQEALNYLLKRGLSEETIQKFHIGFCSDGKYSGRIIIPSFDMFGDLNYFIGRDYTGNNKLKYYNHTNQKQDIIFNEYFINWNASLFLVEGVFDHIVTFNSIPILGKTISKKLIVTIQEKLKGNLYIALDGDALDSAIALKKQLDFGNIKDKVYLIVLPKDEDLSSLYEKYGAKNYYKVLSSYILK
jgi:DNA primase